MNKTKQKIEEPKLKDKTKIAISSSNIIPAGRDFGKEDKEHWVEKIKKEQREV
jgi:hypothetical protein